MASNVALQKIIEEQVAQIVNYEKKLKDVVRAYKSIESEKKALEVALSAISVAQEQHTEGSNNDAQFPDEKKNDGNFEDAPQSTQVEALKQALSTLTIENKKKEMAFQVDRKYLISTRDKLNEEIDRLKKTGNVEVERRLRQQLAEVEAQREKLMAEHGTIVAEMQQRYAKEHIHSEKMEKQVTELSYRLQEKDDQIQAIETRLIDFLRMEQEIMKLRKKAEANPTAQILKQELMNIKDRYEDELLTVRNRHAINAALLGEKDGRISALEARIKILTEENMSVERENAQLHASVSELKKKMDASNVQNVSSWQKPSFGDLKEELRRICNSLKKGNSDVNFLELLNEFLPSKIQTHVIDVHGDNSQCICSDNKYLNDDEKHQKLDENMNGCDMCDMAHRQAEDFKSQILELRRKFNSFEEMHRSTKLEHEQASDSLRQRIVELESGQEHVLSELSLECKRKVIELEEELERQQVRMREIIEEKNMEIEYVRSNLTALRSKNYGSTRPHFLPENSTIALDPLDPKPHNYNQNYHGDLKRICDLEESNVNENSNYLADTLKSSFDSTDGLSSIKHSRQTHIQPQTSVEVRNIYYEQELSSRNQEITELRNMVRLSELKVRDIEQAMLTKDIQYLQIMETLKEEIRVLEGKLSLERSDTNMAYLRNIFLQFINSDNTKSRKHILKAIGAVLKLTIIEMKKIDSWNI